MPNDHSHPGPIPDHLLSLPMRLKCALWLAIGTAMGIPVDALFGIGNGQLDAARRQLAGKRLHLTVAERLQQADWAKAIGHPFHDLMHWLICDFWHHHHEEIGRTAIPCGVGSFARAVTILRCD